MLTKNTLLNIPDVKLADEISHMSEAQIAELEKAFASFVWNYPEQEQEIRKSLKAKDSSFLSTSLEDLCVMLDKIYATDLSAECRKHIETLPNNKPEKNEAYVTYFLSAVSMLSLDIQVSKSKEGGYEVKKVVKDDSDDEKVILAVDDVSVFLTTLQTHLHDTPYKLTCVNSGDAAIRFLADHAPDLFILDIDMPDMNGFELAEKIRQVGHNAPIIFLTGNTSTEFVQKAFEKGASDFLTKPINKKYLLDRINKYI